MKKIIVGILSSLILFIVSPSVGGAAESTVSTVAGNPKSSDPQIADWVSARNQAVTLLKTECHSGWAILWDWAKRGSLEARQILALNIAWGGISMPGRAGDEISRRRDMFILSIFGADGKNQENKNIYEMIKPKDIASFLSCMEKMPSSKCASLAVKQDNYIPKFELYINEIDGLVSDGYQAQCSNK